MFQFPVANVRVTCRFLIYNPFATTPRMHYGMDFGCAVGTPLFAANGGAVVWSGWDSAGGNMVIIHDRGTGELSRYAHLSRRDVRTGGTVTRGQQIGLSGNTGSATTGPHLHFETWLLPPGAAYHYADRAKYAVDPMSVCHLLAGQTFDGNGLATREPIPYPEPDVGARPMRGTVTAHKTAVRLRTIPEVTRYQYIVGGHNRADDVLGDLVAGTSFTAIATCDSDGYTWALIETNRGPFWVALLSGSTSLTLAQGPPAAPVTPDTPTTEQIVVDISTYQETVNWPKVKAAGVDRVVLRQGFRGWGSAGTIRQDNMLESHYAGAVSVGIPVDLYFFSQATNEREAVEEAQTCIDWAKGRQIGRIYLDIETANNGLGRADGNSKATWTAVALAFCAACKAAGYEAGVYANLDYMTAKLDKDALRAAGCLLWLARYTPYEHPEYRGQYDMWQYTSTGKVDGIEGNVDLSRSYIDSAEPVDPDDPVTPSEPEQPTGDVTLIVGPMSGGDYANIKRRAGELDLCVDEPGGGVLTIGPMSAAGRVAIEELAAQLGNIAVKIVDDTPEEPEQPTDAEQIAALRDEVARLTAAAETSAEQITQLDAALAKYMAVTDAVRAAVAEIG